MGRAATTVLAIAWLALAASGARAQVAPSDPVPTAGFASPVFVGPDAAGGCDVPIALSRPATASVTVTYRTVDGSALAGRDYTPASGTVSFQPGEIAKSVRIALAARPSAAPVTVSVQLTGASGAATLSASDLALVVIQGLPGNHEPGTPRAPRAVPLSPPPGYRLSGKSATFVWNGVPGALEYWLMLGTTPGGVQLCSRGVGLANLVTVDGLPDDGRTLYAVLWTRSASGWELAPAVYPAASARGTRATMTSPAPGTALPEGPVRFTWAPGTGADQYWLDIDAGGRPLAYDGWQGPNTSVTVASLPTDGRPLTVRLWTHFPAVGWRLYQYGYTAARETRPAALVGPQRLVQPGWLTAARLATPGGSTLPAGPVTFTWGAAPWAQGYQVDILSGTILIATAATTGSSTTIGGIPTDGRALTVRLWTRFVGTSMNLDYTFLAPSSGGTSTFVQHNLDALNAYRAGKGIAPLRLDDALNAFAQAGSVELSSDHLPHQHFINASNAGTLFTTDGFVSSAGENQGDPNGWSVLNASDPVANEVAQIDAILAMMYAEGSGGGHYDNMMATRFTRVGIGLVSVSGKLYLTNDFSQ